MNILVTGCHGQLGTELQKIADAGTPHRWLFTDVDTLDITNMTAVEECFAANQIDVCINCAAYTAVDLAEEQDMIAAFINSFAPKLLADTCLKNNALLVHVSTDYVFDGTGERPYLETDPIHPQSVYGCTKAEGERLVRESGCNHVIVRTAWLYSSTGKNFVKTMLALADTKDEINVVCDQHGSPTWAGDLAQALTLLVDHYGKGPVSETFHFTNEGQTTWFDFTRAIFDIAGKDCKVNPITTDQYPTKAKRPAYSVLDKSKIKQTLGIEIPFWSDSLARCIEELKNK